MRCVGTTLVPEPISAETDTLGGRLSMQALLVSFLSHQTSEEELSAAPDHIFALILLATTLIMRSNTSIMRNRVCGDKVILLSSEELLSRVMSKLTRVASVSDTAQKCADAMWTLLRTDTGQSASSPVTDIPEMLHHPQAGTATAGMREGGFALDSVFTRHLDFGINSNAILDIEFWYAVAQNLHDT